MLPHFVDLATASSLRLSSARSASLSASCCLSPATRWGEQEGDSRQGEGEGPGPGREACWEGLLAARDAKEGSAPAATAAAAAVPAPRPKLLLLLVRLRAGGAGGAGGPKVMLTHGVPLHAWQERAQEPQCSQCSSALQV